jgi:hypothetical protein
MIQVVCTQHQSVFILKSPLIVKVNYSTLDSELVLLSENIEEVYNDLTSYTSLSRSEFSVLQQRLLSGLYVLSPLRVKFIHVNEFSIFFTEMQASCPDFAYFPSINPDYIIVVLPDEKDVLVYMGLSKMLSRLSYGVLPDDEMDEYHKSLLNYGNMGRVKRLYRLDLTEPLLGYSISKGKILECVKHLVGEGSICYNIIESFLHLPFVDYDNGRHISFDCIPPSGCITWVLENLVLKELFDREFAKRFPSVAFSRMLSQVIIVNRYNDNYSFDEIFVNALIKDLCLPGFVQSIKPGDAPITLYNKKTVNLDKDGKIIIQDKD